MTRSKTKSPTPCTCYNERQSRWVEPSVLYLLWYKARHGYELMADLPNLGFIKGAADPGSVYRMLRHLEENGLVKSEWDTTGSGPAKRLYTITSMGREHLMHWRDALAQRKKALAMFLKKIQGLEKKVG